MSFKPKKKKKIWKWGRKRRRIIIKKNEKLLNWLRYMKQNTHNTEERGNDMLIIKEEEKCWEEQAQKHSFSLIMMFFFIFLAVFIISLLMELLRCCQTHQNKNGTKKVLWAFDWQIYDSFLWSFLFCYHQGSYVWGVGVEPRRGVDADYQITLFKSSSIPTHDNEERRNKKKGKKATVWV